jgi:tRNA A37 threonylcarbamoyltransferase TsaD
MESIQELFQPVLSKILHKVVKGIKDIEEDGSPPNKIVLAGGFSKSPYLRSKIQEAVLPQNVFPDSPHYHISDYNKLLLTQEPLFAVLKGMLLVKSG